MRGEFNTFIQSNMFLVLVVCKRVGLWQGWQYIEDYCTRIILYGEFQVIVLFICVVIDS